MPFENRQEAGRRLAEHLQFLAHRSDVTVLGIPRGGVPVAFETASALHLAMDVFLARKLGVPGQEELAFGALTSAGVPFLEQRIIQATGVTSEQAERAIQQVRALLAGRASLYRGNRAPLQVQDRTIVLVDDGIATGSTVYAALNALQQMGPAKLILAVPVASRSACRWLSRLVDHLVCLEQPEDFAAVGQFYADFSQTSDQQVVDLLRRAEAFPSTSRQELA